MRTVITGASGFIGSHLYKRLAADGVEVVAQRRSPARAGLFPANSVKWADGDVADIDFLRSIFKPGDLVIHLAGAIRHGPGSYETMRRVHVDGTQNVIRAGRERSIRRLVHASSVCTLGSGFSSKEVRDERSEFNLSRFRLGYCETKLEAEKLVAGSVQRGEIDAVVVNPAMAFGAGDAVKESRANFLKLYQGKLKVAPPGGTSVVSVGDVVDGILAAAEKGKSGERYVLTSENLTFADLFRRIASIARVPPPKLVLPRPVLRALGRVGDGMGRIGLRPPLDSCLALNASLYHYYDSAKAKGDLGLKFSRVDDSIFASIIWARAHLLLAA